MRKLLGIAAGIATHVVFAFTVYRLFFFLKGHGPAENAGPQWINALLALQFAVPHSLLLYPKVRERLSDWIPSPFYGCFFCTATCLGLLATIEFWTPAGVVLWQLDGVAGQAVQLAFYASWGALLYSLSLNGLGYQTGWTPWWHWLTNKPLPPRKFAPRGAYRWLRHPVYFSFLGLIWFTPVMTADRAVLVTVWTAYVFVGSHFKDRRMLYYLGDRYADYMARVPGYPLVGFGPLARVSDLKTWLWSRA